MSIEPPPHAVASAAAAQPIARSAAAISDAAEPPRTVTVPPIESLSRAQIAACNEDVLADMWTVG
jgi:hypothetical protein